MHGPLGEATCCRVWVVDLTARIGRCGLCGEVPKVSRRELPMRYDEGHPPEPRPR